MSSLYFKASSTPCSCVAGRWHTHYLYQPFLHCFIPGDLCKNGKDHPNAITVYKAILSYTTNGDQLISRILDNCVHRGGHEDINSKDSYLKVNFVTLTSKDPSRKSIQVIKDMTDVKSPATRALLTHPVIETFLNNRWRRWKKYFMGTFIIYMLFLVTYSVFLGKWL